LARMSSRVSPRWNVSLSPVTSKLLLLSGNMAAKLIGRGCGIWEERVVEGGVLGFELRGFLAGERGIKGKGEERDEGGIEE